MTRKEYDERVAEIDERHKKQEKLTQAEKEILKTRNGIKCFLAMATVGTVAIFPPLFFVTGGLVHHQAVVDRLIKENQAEFDAFKTEQVEKLNEEFDSGKGFPPEEYGQRYDEMQSNLVKDYFATVASEEVKAEYQAQSEVDRKLYISAGVLGGLGVAIGATGFAGALGFDMKRERMMKDAGVQAEDEKTL